MFLMPGMIDAHAHPIAGGTLVIYDLDLGYWAYAADQRA